MVATARMTGMVAALSGVARLHIAGKPSAERTQEGEANLHQRGLVAILHPTFMLSDAVAGRNSPLAVCRWKRRSRLSIARCAGLQHTEPRP